MCDECGEQHCFRQFFNFTFDYLKEDKSVLPLDEAKLVLDTSVIDDDDDDDDDDDVVVVARISYDRLRM